MNAANKENQEYESIANYENVKKSKSGSSHSTNKYSTNRPISSIKGKYSTRREYLEDKENHNGNDYTLEPNANYNAAYNSVINEGSKKPPYYREKSLEKSHVSGYSTRPKHNRNYSTGSMYLLQPRDNDNQIINQKTKGKRPSSKDHVSSHRKLKSSSVEKGYDQR